MDGAANPSRGECAQDVAVRDDDYVGWKCLVGVAACDLLEGGRVDFGSDFGDETVEALGYLLRGPVGGGAVVSR